MDNVVVLIAGLTGWGLAVWLVIRWHDTRRAIPSPVPDGAGAVERLGRATARVTGMVAGALAAGVLVLGLGGRLMMRVLAATSSGTVQGATTDADEIVGEITLGGTIGLLLFVGAFGGLASMALFALLRRWLPDRSVVAGVLMAGIGGALLARPSGLLEPSNADYDILEPTWLALVLGAMVILTFGLAAAVLIDRWAARWPLPGWSPRGVLSLAPLAPLLLVVTPGILIAAAIAITAFVAPVVRDATWLRALDRPLRVLVAGVAVLGSAWVLAAAVEIAA
jgi:hypothetical protein